MTDILVRLAALVAIFASVFLGAQLLLSSTMARRLQLRAVNKRLRLLQSGLKREEVDILLRRNLPRRLPDDAWIGDRLFWKIQRALATAGVSMDARNLLALCLGAFLVLGSLLLLFAWSAKFNVTVGVVELVCGVSAAVTIGVPVMIVSRMGQKRRKRMEEQFPLALDVFTRALRAGHPIAAAIDLLTREVADPLGSEFGLVADEVTYGADLHDALLSLADRWELEDIRMFVICLSVQNETGGNLAEILENLLQVIRERASLYLKVRALSSEGRMSGWMLTALPVLTFISMFAVNPRFYLDVASDPIFVYGFTTLIVMYFLGVVVIRRIIDIKV